MFGSCDISFFLIWVMPFDFRRRQLHFVNFLLATVGINCLGVEWRWTVVVENHDRNHVLAFATCGRLYIYI